MRNNILNLIALPLLLATLIFPTSVFAAESGKPKVLVVYYSKSGNTRAIAEMIREKTSGDIYEIETVKSYPRERPAAVDIPKQELDTGNLPELKGALPEIAPYDLIIIGSPIWWHTAATPVLTFLRDVDFQGKRIAGFYTYAGNVRHFDKDLRERSRNALVLESLSFRGSYDRGVGPEPDGRAYQEGRKEAVSKHLDTWLDKIL